jgi:capsular polysaccharide export protein
MFRSTSLENSAKEPPDEVLFWQPPIKGRVKPLIMSEPQTGCNIGEAHRFNEHKALIAECIARWPQWRISRYNRYRRLSLTKTPYILVVLTTTTESAISQILALAGEEASKQGGDHTIIVASATEGAVLSKSQQDKVSCYLKPGMVSVITEFQHHAPLLEHAKLVITNSYWLMVEALLWAKPVYDVSDILSANKIRLPLTPHSDAANQLLMEYFQSITEVVQPEPQHVISLITAFDWLSFQLQQRERFEPVLYALGFNRFWHNTVRSFFPGSEIRFCRKSELLPPESVALTWGNKALTLPKSVKLFRLEDGFIRSHGLGALFARPYSWIADRTGLYFDATRPSDLEQILLHEDFSNTELEQAKQLISTLITHKVTKYNVGEQGWVKPKTDKRIILVPGQVETDASIKYGSPVITQNMQLLTAVRSDNPDAYLIYKPHPDVLAGARLEGENESSAAALCDEVVTDVAISELFEHVDEVHVLTSLAGFEALLRNKKVYCYGMPFYAGWGLTYDKYPCERRGKKLTLEQLVYAALIRYPLYISQQSGHYLNAIDTVLAISRLKATVAAPLPAWKKLLRKLVVLLSGKK